MWHCLLGRSPKVQRESTTRLGIATRRDKAGPQRASPWLTVLCHKVFHVSSLFLFSIFFFYDSGHMVEEVVRWAVALRSRDSWFHPVHQPQPGVPSLDSLLRMPSSWSTLGHFELSPLEEGALFHPHKHILPAAPSSCFCLKDSCGHR